VSQAERGEWSPRGLTEDESRLDWELLDAAALSGHLLGQKQA
jgi:hypothetical protein